MICVFICYPAFAFGGLGRGLGMLSAVCEFCFALIFCAIVHGLIELFQQALALLEDLRVRKTA
jgi:hypothetical protein